MIVVVALLIINMYIYMSTFEPEKLRIVKERYEILRNNVDGTEFQQLKRCIPSPLTMDFVARLATISTRVPRLVYASTVK